MAGLSKFEDTKFYREGYRVVKKLGEGSYGVTYLVEKRDAICVIQRVAKRIHREEKLNNYQMSLFGGNRDQALLSIRKRMDDLTREVAVLASVRGHKNIAGYVDHEHFRSDNTDGCEVYLWFLKEYCEAVLENVIRDQGLGVIQAVTYTEQAANALEFLHQRSIVHRDVKPDNILVDTNTEEIRLDDFGSSKWNTDGAGQTLGIGTPLYCAPEVDARIPGYDEKLADIFSLGAVFFECLSGRPPFTVGIDNTTNPDEAFRTILSNKVKQNIGDFDFLNPRFQDVIYFATAPKPEHRYQTISEMREALQLLLMPDTYITEAVGFLQRHSQSASADLLNGAFQNLETARKLEPNNKHVWLNLGNAHLLRGNRNEAAACYKKAVKIDPSFTSAMENLKRCS